MILKYLTIIEPRLERPTGGATLNLQELEGKPDSEPPLPDHALKLVCHEDNKRASKLIAPAMQWLAESFGHLHYVVRKAINDPAQTRAWATGATEDDQTQQQMFEAAITKLEEYIEWRYDEPRIEIAYDPEDEPSRNRREAAYTDRKLTTADTDRRIVEELEEVEERTGLPRERAKLQLVAERDRTDSPIGMDRIRRAIQRTNESEKAS